MALHADPDDRPAAADPKPGLLKRLFGGRRKKAAHNEVNGGSDTHILDEHHADADLIQSINGDEDLPPPEPWRYQPPTTAPMAEESRSARGWRLRRGGDCRG